MTDKYRITFRCSEHGKFTKITTKREDVINDNYIVPCPKCKKKKSSISRSISIGDGPITESDLKPKKKRGIESIYQCSDCHYSYPIPHVVGEEPKQACPSCKGENVIFRMTVGGYVPVSQQTKNLVHSVDTTARIVMDDYKMTDLRDDVRAGEAMAPKLAPELQKQADNFFSPKKNNKIPFDHGALKRSAMAGKFRPQGSVPDPIALTHKDRVMPKIDVVADTNRSPIK